MLKLTCTSLGGGQGKTTSVYFLAKLLTEKGYRVLVVDLDPQSNLTTYLRVFLEADDYSCLEFLKEEFEDIKDCLYPVETLQNLVLIPSDDALDDANLYLANSGLGILLLGNRLKKLEGLGFDFCLIDTPPQKSALAQTGIGASNYCLIPVEVKSKGVISLERTQDAIQKINESGFVKTKILGVLPFRDRFIGYNRTTEGEKAIARIEELLEDKSLLLPPWRESVKPEKGINRLINLEDLEGAELLHPFEVLIEKLEKLI